MPPRDLDVLRRIAEHRYLTTHHVTGLCFTGYGSVESAARSARLVVKRLERFGLIRALGRRIGGYTAGSAVNVWQITPATARLLRDDGTNWRTHEPSPRFLAHCLAVADAHLTLLSTATSDRKVTVHVEPDSWRRYTGLGGEPRWLQPDLAATISTGRWTDRWFIEMDLGTESLPTLLRKCGYYETYRQTGIEQESTGGIFPLVLWVFTKTERIQRLREAISRSTRLTPQLYRFATPNQLASVVTEAGI